MTDNKQGLQCHTRHQAPASARLHKAAAELPRVTIRLVAIFKQSAIIRPLTVAYFGALFALATSIRTGSLSAGAPATGQKPNNLNRGADMKRSEQFWSDALPKIRGIVNRARQRGLLAGVDSRFLADALTFTTAENDLDLDRLLAFEADDFGHDVAGILNHSNYKGQFEGCFWPRCGSK